jgi:prephenate dehydratase
VTHFIGRLLAESKFRPTEIDTQGAKKLQEIMQQTCNDTLELFQDLQTHNPATRAMREKLIQASRSVLAQLLPKNVEAGWITIGIQGGKGSFNEIAAEQFINKQKINNSKIKFLFTTKRVLAKLSRGEIDLGVFAIANSRGGLVDESLAEIGKFEFQIRERIVLPIQHHLMKRSDIALNKIHQVMAHDQVFKQCANTLAKKYPQMRLIQGKGNLVDTAKAAEALSLGRLSKSTAILGNKKLADLFGLEIVDNNLQDDPDNRTTFMVVSRL